MAEQLFSNDHPGIFNSGIGRYVGDRVWSVNSSRYSRIPDCPVGGDRQPLSKEDTLLSDMEPVVIFRAW